MAGSVQGGQDQAAAIGYLIAVRFRDLAEDSVRPQQPQLTADLSRIKGNLHPDVVTEVVAAVKRAPTLSPAEQTRIADALSSQVGGGN